MDAIDYFKKVLRNPLSTLPLFLIFGQDEMFPTCLSSI